MTIPSNSLNCCCNAFPINDFILFSSDLNSANLIREYNNGYENRIGIWQRVLFMWNANKTNYGMRGKKS